MENPIQDEIYDFIKTRLNKEKSVIQYREYLEYYSKSPLLSEPYKIFQKFFRLFWLDVKELPLIKFMPVKPEFDIEAYFQFFLFNNCIDYLMVSFDSLYKKTKAGYKPDKDAMDFFLVDKIKNILYLPQILLAIGRNERKSFDAALRNIKKEKLLLPPNDKEILNSKIIDAVNEFHDMGKGSFSKAYKELSKKSKELFGHQLSEGQIRGRYERASDKRTPYN